MMHVSNYNIHCVSFLAETYLCRRLVDLHILISSAVVAMLGLKLYTEQITDILQEEEGR